MTKITDLKFVVLRVPYDNLDDPYLQKFYGRMLALKLRGYQKEHPYGILPVDQLDVIADHYMICERDGVDWRPIMCMRAVSLERCQIHSLPFAPLTHLANNGYHAHARAVQSYIDHPSAMPKGTTFDGSLTIDPYARARPELAKIVGEAVPALHYLYHQNTGISHCVIGGTLRFKIDRLLTSVGYDPLTQNGEALGAVEFPFMNNEAIAFFIRNRFSEHAIELGAKYQALWDDRIEIGQDRALEFRKAA